ncbi:MAG: DUF502 domain-containing protein [Dehalococcoidia bacterium]|nr:DUF502 domain-containing protein [Dehalococcoidia bacterium]
MNGNGTSHTNQDALHTRKREALPFRIRRHVWQSIARGFLLLIPLFITILILRYLVGFAGSVISPFVGFVISRPFLEDIPGATLLVWAAVTGSVLAVFYFLGMLVTGEKGQNRVAMATNAFLGRIPIVKSIYDVANQTTHALSTPRENAFSRVVFLEWPRPGVRALGLVTGQCVLPHDERTMLVIYIATVPNPTSGMLAVIPEDEVIDAGISVEQAMKIIFSGGIVIPEGLRETITVVKGETATP